MFRINYDALGIAASLACAIHCAILPLILTSLPILGINIIGNMGFEYFMIFLAMLIGFYSLWHGYRLHHRSLLPSALFGMGIVLLFLKQTFHSYQYFFLLPAVILIVAAHLLNLRYCRRHGQCVGNTCKHSS